MDKKTLRQDNAGMSLLELVVAVSIFMILALVLFGDLSVLQRLNKKSGIYLSATTMAQNIMEEIKSKTFAQVALAFNYPINPITNENRFGFLQDLQDTTTDGRESSVTTKELLKSDNTYKKSKAL